jgi:hypothetical protein
VPRHLHLAITEPCAEEWDAMTGSSERRHCARCDKHVIALSEMTPEEADTLVRSSKPHSLCLRVEHDEDGTVLFRERPETTVKSRPIVRLAVGASLLVAACGKPEPPAPAPDPPRTEQVSPEKPSSPDQPTPPDCVKAADPQGQTEVGSNAQRATDARREKKGGNERKTRVTTGCACEMSDPLCSCL